MTTAAAAAEELADLLKELAAQCGSRLRPKQVRFGSRLGRWLKRRSPKGFVLDSSNLQMLLPDGRLWSYNCSDAMRYRAGRYFDVRTDYANFARSSSFFGGTRFTFLGVVLGSYTFGLADQYGRHSGPARLSAICTEGKSIRYMDAAEALTAIANQLNQGTADSVARHEPSTAADPRPARNYGRAGSDAGARRPSSREAISLT